MRLPTFTAREPHSGIELRVGGAQASNREHINARFSAHFQGARTPPSLP
jgi:hypothetical protein